MEIDGTVTITLRDYSRLRKLANRGTKTLSLHEELLDKTALLLSDVIYDPEIEPETAERVIEKLRMMARSLPEINFYADKENNRIVLKLRQ